MTAPVVVDASVGAKWFLEEAGSAEARDLLRQHLDGDIVLVVPTVFVFEVLDVCRRRLGHDEAQRLWADLSAAGIEVTGMTLVDQSLYWSRTLGCTLYDAAAPALAEAIDAKLVSADWRAHARYPGIVRIIG